MVGACAGLLISAPWLPVFLIAGLVIGHFYDLRHDVEGLEKKPRPLSRSEIDRDARARFATHVATLLMKVARADGAASDEELDAVDRYLVERLGYDAEDASAINRALAAATSDSADLLEACERCRTALNEPERLLLVNALYDIATVDGPITRSEAAMIDEIARFLSLSDADRAAARSAHVSTAGDAWYQILGITAEVSDEEVKRAFRQLAARHHPDKVAHLGAMAVQMATDKFNEIREAYEEIRTARGL
jgi:DnaJ like chaperone protein